MIRGYKETEVGLIPADWEVKSLKHLGKFKKGKNIPKSVVTQDGVPCVLYGEIYTRYNDVVTKLVSNIPKAVAKYSTEIQYGDILFAGSGETAAEIGKSFAYCGTEKAYAGGDVIIFTPEATDPRYLGYLLNTRTVIRQKTLQGQGSSVFHIYPSGLEKIKIPIPPTKIEQTSIAAPLKDADDLITSLELLIAKKRAIKQGAMQELLKPKKGWKFKFIRELVNKSDGIKIGPFGSALKKEYLVSSGFKVYGQENIFEQNMGIGKRYINKNRFNTLKACELLPGDFIISMMGTIGKCMIVPQTFEQGIMDSHLIRLRLNQVMVDINYLYHYFLSESLLLQVNTFSVGGIMSGLSSKIIKQISLPIPPKKQSQTEIAQILSDMDTEIALLNQKLEKQKRIKQGMMQVLLTGKSRLV